MRFHWLALACLAVLGVADATASSAPPPQTQALADCKRAHRNDVIQSVSPDGDVVLVSGQTVKLLDVRLPIDGPEFGRTLDWLRSLGGGRVSVAAAQAGADRWGRVAADVALINEASPLDLAERLIAEGMAIVDAGDRGVLCRPDLLIVEDRARARRAGLWAGAQYAPVSADNAERLRALVGRYALVEGIIRSVGERRERTYLNFGQDWSQDLTITIPKRTWSMMQERGLTAAELRGKRIRARGIVEAWQGVTIEITAPGMLEFLAQGRIRR